MFSNEDQGRVYNFFFNFITFRAGVHVIGHVHVHVNHIHVVKMQNFSPFQGIKQKNWIYSNDDQVRVYQNLKFHDPRVRVVVLGCTHVDDIVKMLNFL